MKPKSALKNIYRSWVRSAFIVILLGAVTYSLFSNVMEFYVTKRESERAIELYDGVGTMDYGIQHAYGKRQINGEYILTDSRVSLSYWPESYAKTYREYVPYAKVDNEDIDEIEQMELVSYVDRRYMTAGISEEYYRLDMDERYYYDFTNCFVIEGTVDMWHEDKGALLLSDYEIIAGKTALTFTKKFDRIWIKCQKDAPAQRLTDGTVIYPEVWANGPTFITEKGEYTAEYCSALNVGDRYVFIVRLGEIDWLSVELPEFYLTDQFTYDWCDAVWDVTYEGENYLENDKFTPLVRYIELMNADMHTFDVVYTQNMGAIRYFADGTMGIVEGRRLNREDYLGGADVCVIHHEMAREYDLEVGDTITLKLGNKLFEQYEGIGAIAAVPGRLSTEYTEVTLEIVGIWKDVRGLVLKGESPDPMWSYSVNTVFVPTHLLNADEGELSNHGFTAAEFSFVIENVYDVETFEKNSAYRIKNMGLKLTLDDGNWKEIRDAFEESGKMAVIKITILAAAVVVSTCFTVLLYVFGRKRDFAIMRVLGAEKKRSRQTITLPLIVLAAAGVIIGTVAAWIYTVNNISLEFSVSQIGEFSVSETVPIWLVAACIAAEMLLAYGAASVLLGLLGRQSPLELLQDRARKTAKKQKKTEKIPEAEKVELGKWVSLTKPAYDGKNRKIQFVLRYILRNIGRTKSKTVLYILVSVLLLNVSGQINILLDTYTTAFYETEVVSSYAGSLNLHYVSKLQETGYVRDVFYQSEKHLDINGITVASVFTNDVDKYLGRETDIEFIEGYGVDDVTQGHDRVLVITSAITENYGIKPGDTVKLAKGFQYETKLSDEVWSYVLERNFEVTRDEAEKIVKPSVDRWYNNHSDEFLVIGSFESEDEKAYLPGTLEMDTTHGKLVIISKTEAILKDNWKVREYREYGEALADANLTHQVAFIMDTSRIEHLANNILLLRLLYPVSVAAMLIIAAFMTSLIIAQTSKDIAIMRVLGTSKVRTRIMIVTERIILCAAAVIFAVVIMIIMRGADTAVMKKAAVAAGMYFGAVMLSSIAASVAATRKNVLELLQTKE